MNTDDIIKYCTARIVSDTNPNSVIGSGVLVRQEAIGEKVYLITAAHCLEDETKAQLSSILVEIYNPSACAYEQIRVDNLQSHCVLSRNSRDVSVVMLRLSDVLRISPELPTISLVVDSIRCANYKCAGFPNANDGNYTCSSINWNSRDTTTCEMFFHLEDYLGDFVQGYSGGGIFCETHQEVILIGIISKYREEERGRILYALDLSKLNEDLYYAHRKEVIPSYIIAENITEKTITDHLDRSYQNLGDRFIKDFNIPVPIQRKIEAVCRTEVFYDTLEKRMDKWLMRYRETGSQNLHNVSIDDLWENVLQFAYAMRKHDSEYIDITLIKTQAQTIIGTLEEEFKSINIANAEITDEQRREYATQRQNIAKQQQYCDEIVSILTSSDIHIANSQILIIEGEAGRGKSQLLGHFSLISSNLHVPAVLLLGDYFASGNAIEKVILNHLHAICTIEECLEGLNQIGRRLGRRIPIMIDALNETEGMKYWQSTLPGFVDLLREYPNLALIVTVRDIYKEHVISAKYLKEWKDRICVHDGFGERGYEAVENFCIYYGLNFLHMPIMDPEFSNPLFLHMACKIAKEANLNELPTRGDIHNIFEKYAEMLDEKLAQKKPDLYSNRKIASKAILAIAREVYATHREYIPLDRCDTILLNYFAFAPELLNDLLGESLLSKEIDLEENEYIRFTYQRMTDYYVAKMLLDGCNTIDEVARTLNKESAFIIKNYQLEGVLQQLYIMLPTRYNVELFEIIDLDDVHGNIDMLFYSLHWRPVENVHPEVITRYLENRQIKRSRWWNALLYLAVIPGHPYNGELWHRTMKGYTSMADRDGELQPYILDTIRWYPGTNEMQRLINWAWTPSDRTTDEAARLGGLTLIWFLSSTIHQLRDQTTKALINLLWSKPHVLISLLQEFHDVNDVYIHERLMAITYGCVLRCKQKDGIVAIGEYVYGAIFAGGNPPAHLLLRDYACNIVDYAHRVCGLDELDMILVYPPYRTQMPELPEEEDVGVYKIDYNDKGEKYAVAQNYILHSVYDGLADFGTKIVDPSIDYFAPWNFNIEAEYQAYRFKKSKKIREYLDMYQNALENRANPPKLHIYGKVKVEEHEQLWKKIVDAVESEIRGKLPQSEFERIVNEYIPNHMLVGKSRYGNRRNKMPYRYWIVKRVFDMGYDRNKHGQYDITIKGLDESFSPYKFAEGRKERIGKKYEWIAYWELLSYFADNYYIEDPWDSSHQIQCEGTWLNYLRDCDPGCITKRNDEEIVSCWQEYPIRNNWDVDGKEWLSVEWTLDEVQEMIERQDDDGNKWFTIHDDQLKRAPKELGQDEYNYKRFFSYHIMAYLIRKEDKSKAISMAGKVNLLHHEIARPVDSSVRYISREKYWSRACDVDKDVSSKVWDELYRDSGIKVMVPFVNMNGSFEDEYAGTRATYYMPIQKIFEEMGLQYGSQDGNLVQNDVICATCNPNRTIHFLMQRDALIKYLNDNGLDMIWAVNHEKYYSDESRTFSDSIMYEHGGIFYLDDNGELQGKFIVNNRNEREDLRNPYAKW